MMIKLLWAGCLLVCLTAPLPSTSQQGEGGFVEKLGEELWQLGQLVTKYSEITTKYRQKNARVDTNDGRNLTGQIVENVGRLLERRTQAVKCIQEEAENLIKESNRSIYGFLEKYKLEYFNMRLSGESYEVLKELSDDIKENITEYISLTLTKDQGFYSIPVNKEQTAVHIPVNLYDRYPEVAESIFWSADLNETFVRNYKNDPEIGWQYYGASTGMMRQYPAMMLHQEDEEAPDMFDCRTRPWYIEAATCGKDVVILMDNSGSMTGMRNTIAKLVVNKLLTTFSNNDYINVMNFSWTASPVVPCFKSLVQANVHNVKHLTEAVNLVSPAGNASVPTAFTAAFEMLKEAREVRGCGDTSECQQVIFFIADGLPGNITEVFEKYNRLEDGTAPVRVFTYLLGLEVRGVLEIKDIACENRGMYTHITALDQVQDEVLRYINVMARPLALQQVLHPPRWTHLFADIDDPRVSNWLVSQEPGLQQQRYVESQYFSQARLDQTYVAQVTQVEGEEAETTYKKYRMMTSVAIPVFDLREVSLNESDELLAGVAGIDIPIRDIYKLTYPYKIGANGYAFIVTNNGHLLMHPDHRPVSQGFLTENYNSVDLLDVEFAVTEGGKKKLRQIRDAMVDLQEDFQNVTVKVKFHYDDLRRVGVERRDYYFSPLPGTPFSLGLAIPTDYGNYQIGVKDVINEKFLTAPTDENIFEEFFSDPEWRIHPHWEYCRYKYASYMSFESKEAELVHILDKIDSQLDWRRLQKMWRSERDTAETDSNEDMCDLPEAEEDSHYCDPDLIKLLMFDASVTLQSFQEPVKTRNAYEAKLLTTYNATLRFVASQSGLTRWKKIPQPEGDEDRGDFGNEFPYAIEEPWFKAAVLQYNLDTKGEYNKDGDSFVFSVPFNDAVAEKRDDLSVMATIAIFPRDGGRKAPASVVGYRLTYASFYNRTMELAYNYSVNCKSEDIACYIIDHNAYVVMSSQQEVDVGRALMVVRKDVMERLLNVDLYRAIEILDYQAIKVTRNWHTLGSAAGIMEMPLSLIIRTFSWLWTFVAWNLLENFGLAYGAPVADESDENFDYRDAQVEVVTEKVPVKNLTKVLRVTSEPVINKHTLYLLQQQPQFYIRSIEDAHSSLISARRIEHTNLILVVVDLNVLDGSMDGQGSVEPEAENATVCARYEREQDLHKRRLANCISCHPKEAEIQSCGLASTFEPTAMLYVLLMIPLLCSILFSFRTS